MKVQKCDSAKGLIVINRIAISWPIIKAELEIMISGSLPGQGMVYRHRETKFTKNISQINSCYLLNKFEFKSALVCTIVNLLIILQI
jgi:hypothetical protein